MDNILWEQWFEDHRELPIQKKVECTLNALKAFKQAEIEAIYWCRLVEKQGLYEHINVRKNTFIRDIELRFGIKLRQSYNSKVRVINALGTVQEKWGSDFRKKLGQIYPQQVGVNFSEALRNLAKRVPNLNEALPLLNQQVELRIDGHRKKNSSFLLTGELNKVIENLKPCPPSRKNPRRSPEHQRISSISPSAPSAPSSLSSSETFTPPNLVDSPSTEAYQNSFDAYAGNKSRVLLDALTNDLKPLNSHNEKPTAEFIDSLIERQRMLTQKAMDYITVAFEELRQLCAAESRLHDILESMILVFETAKEPEIITFNQYIATDWTQEDPRYKYVICSPNEVEKIYQRSPPRMPLWMPAELLTPKKRLRIMRFFQGLKATRSQVDVTIFDKKIDMVNNTHLETELMPTEKVIEAFMDKEKPTLNLLELPCGRAVFGDLIDNIPALQILKDLLSDDMGKLFSVLSKALASSWWHEDRHGVVTVGQVEEGHKLWFMCTNLSLKERVELVGGVQYPSIPILLREGDGFMQPGRTMHAVASITNVLVSAVELLDTRESLPALEASIEQCDYPELTNEGPAKEAAGIFKAIGEIWGKDAEYPFGEESDKEQYMSLIPVYEQRLQKFAEEEKKRQRRKRRSTQNTTQKKRRKS